MTIDSSYEHAVTQLPGQHRIYAWHQSSEGEDVDMFYMHALAITDLTTHPQEDGALFSLE